MVDNGGVRRWHEKRDSRVDGTPASNEYCGTIIYFSFTEGRHGVARCLWQVCIKELHAFFLCTRLSFPILCPRANRLNSLLVSASEKPSHPVSLKSRSFSFFFFFVEDFLTVLDE